MFHKNKSEQEVTSSIIVGGENVALMKGKKIVKAAFYNDSEHTTIFRVKVNLGVGDNIVVDFADGVIEKYNMSNSKIYISSLLGLEINTIKVSTFNGKEAMELFLRSEWSKYIVSGVVVSIERHSG